VIPGTTVENFPLYVGGEWIEAGEKDTVRLPYDGSAVGTLPLADEALAQRAVEAAREGAKAMAALTPYERAELLDRVREEIRKNAEEFTRLVCAESGKPIKEARVEVDRSQQTLLAAAHEARQLHGEVVPMEFSATGKGRMAITVREPLGVIAAITPFNVPMNLALHKAAPALAGGNAVIHKPAERTPLSAARLARAFADAGVPKGAYNFVHGSGPLLGSLFLSHPGVDMLTFTGSARVGRELRSKAGLKRITLELGNNSAVIVEPDADLATAVTRTVQGAFSHSGQVCISVQRAFVHESLFNTYLDRLKTATERLKLGHPFEESTDISSLIDEPAAKRVEEWIAEAVRNGAKTVTGGPRKHATIAPTILTNVSATARISCEEVFGPVVAVYPYTSLEDAIARVNDTPYGLQAGIFTQDLQRAFRAARQLRFGGVMINDVPMYRADHMPYGGVKDSGIGREGPRYAIEEMTEMKLICWKV
jgi:acyl-CoA reductase-like NAD-dependent aldehyde dehydrogenase